MLIAVLARPVDGAYEGRRQFGSSVSSLVAPHKAYESTRNPLRCPEAAIVNVERRLCVLRSVLATPRKLAQPDTPSAMLLVA